MQADKECKNVYDAYNLMENVTRVNLVAFATIEKELWAPIATYTEFQAFAEEVFHQLSTFNNFYALVAKQKMEQEVVDEMLEEMVMEILGDRREGVMEEGDVGEDVVEVIDMDEDNLESKEADQSKELDLAEEERKERDRDQEMFHQDEFLSMMRDREPQGLEANYGVEEGELSWQERQEQIRRQGEQEQEIRSQGDQGQEIRSQGEQEVKIRSQEVQEEDEVLECRKGG